MNSSGIKRGLAASAVSALAVAGLPFLATSASAQPIAADYPAPNGIVEAGDLELLNPDEALASVSTQAYDLVAAGNADVAQVQFQFSATGAAPWTNIGAPADRIDGAFTRSWTPSASGTVRALPLNAAGDAIEAAAASQTVAVGLLGDAVTAQIAGDNPAGVWNSKAATAGANDYTMAVTGTTSMSDSSTSALDDGYRVLVEARTGSAGTAFADVTGETAPGNFGGVLPLPGYVFPAGGPDQIVVGAEPQDATGGVDGPRNNVEDADAKSLYLQQLGSVTATAGSTNLPPGETTSVTVSALDQNGKAIAGARVYKSVNGAAAALVGTTDAFGKLVDNGAGGGLGTGSYKYHVNAPATTVDNPQTSEETALGDKSSTVAIAVYTPALTAVNVFALYGAVSDLDEVDLGTPFVATAVDQNGNPMGNEQLHYTWTVDPFDPALPTVTSNEIAAAALTDNTPGATKGTVALRMANATDFTPNIAVPSGTWTLKVYRKPVGGLGAFSAAPVDYKIGESAVEWTPADAQGPMAGSLTVKGTLALEDGSALGSLDRAGTANDVDRTANLAYLAGTEENAATPAPLDGGAGDSRIAPLAQQDATVTGVNIGGTTGTAKFNAAGVVNVKVNDANPETQEEFDAVLTADPTGLLSTGDGNTDATSVNVDFLTSVVASSVSNTSITTLDANGATPGRPVTVKFTVRNANGAALSGKTVNITVAGGGFITDEAEAPLTTAQTNGVWANKTATGTVTTDAAGVATVVVAIERNAGFDDNFLHTVGITASVDGKSASRDVVFRSQDAVDVGSIDIAPAASNTADLPDAQVQFETVKFDVFAKDQFGNLSEEDYSASDDTTRADFDIDNGLTQSLDGVADLEAFADLATSQTISVSAEDPQGAAPSSTVDDSAAAINWYVVDFADPATTFTLGQQGPESVPAGSRVTEVMTVLDQKAHAVNGLDVKFLRSGPSDEDSDLNWVDSTDVRGQAFYDFVGGTAGTARISAVVTNPFANDVRVGTAEDTVTFTGVITPLADINLRLTGKDNGKKADKLTANAKANASGLVAKLYKKVNGNLKLVKKAKLNASGNHLFKVADKNGKAKTKYVVKVAKSAKTKADQASKRVR